MVKKTQISDFKNINKSGLISIGLKEGDEVIGVKLTDGDQDVMLVTRSGMSIRFSEKEVTDMVVIS